MAELERLIAGACAHLICPPPLRMQVEKLGELYEKDHELELREVLAYYPEEYHTDAGLYSAPAGAGIAAGEPPLRRPVAARTYCHLLLLFISILSTISTAISIISTISTISTIGTISTISTILLLVIITISAVLIITISRGHTRPQMRVCPPPPPFLPAADLLPQAFEGRRPRLGARLLVYGNFSRIAPGCCAELQVCL